MKSRQPGGLENKNFHLFFLKFNFKKIKFRKKVDGLEDSVRNFQSQIADLEKRLDEKITIEKENKSQKITEEYKTAIRKLKNQLKSKIEENEQLKSKTNSFQAENNEKLNKITQNNDQLKNDLKNLNSSKEKELSVLEEKIAEMIKLCAQLEKDKHHELNKNQTLKQTIEQVILNFKNLIKQIFIFFLVAKSVRNKG